MSVEIRVPALGESIVEATISRWLKRPGDPVAAGEEVVELETDKVNVAVPVEQPGILTSISRQEGETVAVNEVLGILAEAGSAEAPAAPAAENGTATVVAAPASGVTAESAAENGRGGKSITPLAKKIVEETGVDVGAIHGSGPGGKITRSDVLPAPVSTKPAPSIAAPPVATPGVPPPPQTTSAKAVAAASSSAAPAGSGDRREQRIPMTRRRIAIARNLVMAQQTAAMLTTFNEVDMSAVMEIRKRRKDSFKERHGVGLGFMSFFTKASLGALKAFPYLNAEIQGADILLKEYYDIGIAVGTPAGLVVPVLRDADRKSFAAIEREIGELAGRARDNKLSLAELQGGTFTITNGGIFGSMMSTPILNTPQVGILGMHKIQERPMVVNGEIVIRPMMYLALSYDHRIVDGSEAVRFLVRIKELLEDPESLLLEG